MDVFERLIRNPVLRATIGARRRLLGPKRPSWTLEMEIVAEFMRLYSPVLMRLSPELQRKGAASILKSSALAEETGRERARVNDMDAEWFIPARESHEAVLYYLHGGGYVLGSLSTHQNLISGLSADAGCRAFAIDYRLAPEHPFPRAVEDAVEGYRYLIDRGIAPSRIVIAGESAGGGLTLSTLLELRARGLPQPAAAVLISPWCDLEGRGASLALQADTDYITKPYLDLCARWLLDGKDPRHPLASPVHADLAGLPALYIQAGGSEGLLDDSIRVAQRAREAGVDVDLDVHPDMVHAWHVFASFLPEARLAIRRVGEFVRRKTGADAALVGAA